MTQFQFDVICKLIDAGAPALAPELKNAILGLAKSFETAVAENEQLKEIVESDDKSEYIEQVAREQLGFGMPNEKVFYDVTPGA
jgi:cell division protein FtsB